MGEYELREWLRLEEGDDTTISSLLITSKALIKKSTGITYKDIEQDEESKEIYKTIQKIIVTRLYENRECKGDVEKGLIPMYTALKYSRGETNGYREDEI